MVNVRDDRPAAPPALPAPRISFRALRLSVGNGRYRGILLSAHLAADRLLHLAAAVDVHIQPVPDPPARRGDPHRDSDADERRDPRGRVDQHGAGARGLHLRLADRDPVRRPAGADTRSSRAARPHHGVAALSLAHRNDHHRRHLVRHRRDVEVLSDFLGHILHRGREYDGRRVARARSPDSARPNASAPINWKFS